MKFKFEYNEKIELEKPLILVPMERWNQREIDEYYGKARKISAQIPSRIRQLDEQYMEKYESLQLNPDDFFEIMEELNGISSKISELNALYLKIEGKHLQSDKK
ncbi:hypothetical protein BEP19_04500 [Ammoniphilus oxalaticus]|uniref:Hydrolase/acyltransferase n=1 Tax=Ammoniphilus oxalaticus TaxID=66863 RepID=A0A419SM46_9BACL|nr:hypothetical protein [Ammoniphilus oxalaticus]RKD25086.1 hypothetical protein BEP19_04500 [Ammoniphilus oxalaticus]